MVDAGEILDKLTRRFTLTPIGEREFDKGLIGYEIEGKRRG